MKAFPSPIYDHPKFGTCFNEGMDLRDYFAAKSMEGLIASPRPPAERDENGYTAEIYARFAYDVADAMMEARKK